jgi:hypothetical protein
MKTTVGFIGLFLAAQAAVAAPNGMYYTQQMAEKMKPSSSQLAGQGNLLYYGGQVISHVKVYAVMWGPNVQSTVTSNVSGFFTAVTNSTHFDFLEEYNTKNIKAQDGRDGTNQDIGRGSFGGLYTITPANTSNKLQDTDIEAELEAQITAGKLPKNDDNSLYMTYFPPGVSITIDGQTSCQAFCAYHMGFVSKTLGNVFYGVMPDLGGACSFGCGFQMNPFDSVSIISAHELVEATTDPFPTPGNTPAFPQAWNTTDGSEIGDVCAFTENQLTTPNQTYKVQGEWDNASKACTTQAWQSP